MNYGKLKFEEDDQLNRKDFVVNLMKVIFNWNKIKNESDSLVVSIDSPWGSGKSYLLNMWKNWLLSRDNMDNNYAVAYYNAWENDDNENAFIPLAYALQNMELHKNNNELEQSFKNRTTNFIKACIVAFVKDSIKKHVGENVSNIINAGIDDSVDINIETFFDEYNKYKKQKTEFKEALCDLIPRDGKLIVFIDELDRCRPTFAVETLETIKHYFDVSGIIFVFAVDLEQLSYSVSTLYGEGMDSSGYLRRFFDLNINIPKVNIVHYVRILYKDFVKAKNINHNLFNTVANLYARLNLSLRDMNKITDNFIVFCLYYDEYFSPNNRQDTNIIDILETYLFFMILKYKYPNTYNHIIHNNYIAYDNQPQHYEVLDIRFFVSDNISKMLRALQNGNAHIKSNRFVKEYGENRLYMSNLSFAEHIEQTIEMFVSNRNEKTIEI